MIGHVGQPVNGGRKRSQDVPARWESHSAWTLAPACLLQPKQHKPTDLQLSVPMESTRFVLCRVRLPKSLRVSRIWAWILLLSIFLILFKKNFYPKYLFNCFLVHSKGLLCLSCTYAYLQAIVKLRDSVYLIKIEPAWMRLICRVKMNRVLSGSSVLLHQYGLHTVTELCTVFHSHWFFPPSFSLWCHEGVMS